ncbi:FAD:protein FMN transferase [Rhodobacteraceae bacterium HSP-20]|uniref:FAD:protein FMN transferase n=1 Tax=Paragemmobacter amnigenus TaxID=2852097 RepID=A0ABS6J2B1_9RHOB|nr:FAD:protein FMN transferase [Rhodobacter amnigenus]MBU9697672.1 FAD:protein FMN transferase [Rhodobacter amnigenus]MBV4388899.1 FAD:protein FMN transferase [Rhodobacter amnigenus]
MTTRRRFLLITAALALSGPAHAARPFVWTGTAMGSAATIRLTHPEAASLTARAAGEIDRLEDIFSLYRANSTLSRLNATGHIDAPPFELLECLSIAAGIHDATEGLFDPTVQRLWQMQAEAATAGRPPTAAERRAALAITGWHRVARDADRVTLPRGMALTLNGIAQGYVADRIARLLQGEGLTDVLIDTGEMQALGPRRWPVHLPDGTLHPLAAQALATSAPRGTVLDPRGQVGHILDPRTGDSAPPVWRSVSVAAPSAAIADALSTAACLMPDEATIRAALARVPDSTLIQTLRA